MSGRILRQVRVAQTIPSPALVLPSRRCYAVAVAKASNPKPDAQPVAGPSHSRPAQGEAWQSKAPEDSSQNGGTALAQSSSSQAPASPAGAPQLPETPSAFPKGVEEHLASVVAAGLEPTQSDLEKCRPAKPARADSPGYAKEYHAVVDTLCRCFSKAQLRKFIAGWDVNSRLASANRRKVDYAESIVEKMWGWPSLKEVERAKKDRTEASARSFPVNASQMFLIMGKDGADVLEMSRSYNVHISLKTDPFALHVEGVRASLKKVAERIDAIKKSITEEIFRLPTKAPIAPDLLQRISRLAGALLENIGSKGTIRILAKTPRSADIAKRLVTRACHELQLDLQRERLAYQPSSPTAEGPVPNAFSPSAYALYPFLSPKPLPWTMNAGSTFRMRHVGSWLKRANGEDIHATKGLAGRGGRLLTTTKESIDLREALFRDLPSSSTSQPPCRRVVKASTGHMLLSASSPAQRVSLVPPLAGKHTLHELLDWMSARGARTGFVPSLPAPLVSSSPTTDKIIHRLVYRAVQPTTTEGPHHAHANKFLSFDVALVQPRDGFADAELSDSSSRMYTEPSQADDDPAGNEAAIPALYTEPECVTGVESEVDVMLPDRPMDIHFSAQSSTLITSDQQPPELRAYIISLGAFLTDDSADGKQPDPPLMLSFGSDTWIMHSSASVRQSIETITVPCGTPATGEAGHSMRVVSESILDLESNQKSAHCELVCDDPTSMESWGRFLASCDALTSISYQPMGDSALGTLRK